MENKQPYYRELKLKKELNELFAFNTINRDQLKKLWDEETVFDDQIANLFDVTIYKVKKKRKELRVMFGDCVMDKVIEDLKNRKDGQSLLNMIV